MLKRRIIKLIAGLAITLSLLGGGTLGAHETTQATMYPACASPILPPCF